MMRHLGSFLAIFTLCFAGLSSAIASPGRLDLAVGQVWSIKEAGGLSAKVIIGRIDPPADGAVTVHVGIVDVTGAGPLTAISHVPFEKGALVASLDKLLATGAALPPGFAHGYAQWKADDDGAYTIGVAEALGLTAEKLKHPAPPADASPT